MNMSQGLEGGTLASYRLVAGRDRALRNVRRFAAWIVASATIATGGLIGLAAHETTLHSKAVSSSGQSQPAPTSSGAGGAAGSQMGGSSGGSVSGGSGANGSAPESGSGSAPAPSSGPALGVTGQT